MKKTILTVSLVAFLGALLLSAGIPVAEARMGRNMDNRDGAFMRGLELTSEQRDKMRGLMRKEGRNMSRQMRDFHDDLEVLGSNPSEEQIDNLKTRLSDSIFQGMKLHYEMGRILTTEQRKELGDRWESGKTRMGHDRGDVRQRYNRKLSEELDLSSEQQKKLEDLSFTRSGMHMMAYCTEELDLTEDQQDKIENIIEAYRPEDGKGFMYLRDSRKEMNDLISADTFDEDKAENLAMERTEDMIEGFMKMKEMESEILKVLDEDQKEEFMEMKEDRPGHDRSNRGSRKYRK